MTYKKCVCCEESIKPKDIENFGEYYTNEGKAIHYSCLQPDESEPILRVYPIGNNEDLNNLEYSGYGFDSFSVGYYHDQTEGLFYFSHYRSDSWRGHYQPTSEKYTEIEDNHITMGYGNDQELKEQKERIFKIVEQNKLRAVYIISITSNICSSGLGYWIHNQDLEKFKELNQK